MRRGYWHQFGDRSQKLVQELLEKGVGVGVVLSPRDLSFNGACRYAEAYKALGAEVLLDLQFYVPGFTNLKMETYSVSEFRPIVYEPDRLVGRECAALAGSLESVESAIGVDAVLAPAVSYESGRRDLAELNSRLFRIAKAVGDSLGVPTYSTVIIGNSSTASTTALQDALSQATALDADGWYFGFEFRPERIPSELGDVLRCCQAGLALACTGMPVLHAYAGPMALLSHGFGATGAAVGHSQNLWRFDRDRWGAPPAQGGGGDAPPRFFSSALWGTIVYPDEIVRLPPDLREQIITATEFSLPVTSNVAWDRWDANKHFVAEIGHTVEAVSQSPNPQACLRYASAVLERAINLHGRIASAGMILRDYTAAYQSSWLRAIQQLATDSRSDFEYLSLLT